MSAFNSWPICCRFWAETGFCHSLLRFRLVFSGIGFAQQVDGPEGFRAGATQRVVYRLCVHRFKAAFGDVIHAGIVRHHLELPHVGGERWQALRRAQHARKVCAHSDGSEWRGIFLWNILQRAIQPAIFGAFRPGVPDSIKSCASK